MIFNAVNGSKGKVLEVVFTVRNIIFIWCQILGSVILCINILIQRFGNNTSGLSLQAVIVVLVIFSDLEEVVKVLRKLRCVQINGIVPLEVGCVIIFGPVFFRTAVQPLRRFIVIQSSDSLLSLDFLLRHRKVGPCVICADLGARLTVYILGAAQGNLFALKAVIGNVGDIVFIQRVMVVADIVVK